MTFHLNTFLCLDLLLESQSKTKHSVPLYVYQLSYFHLHFSQDLQIWRLQYESCWKYKRGNGLFRKQSRTLKENVKESGRRKIRTHISDLRLLLIQVFNFFGLSVHSTVTAFLDSHTKANKGKICFFIFIIISWLINSNDYYDNRQRRRLVHFPRQ